MGADCKAHRLPRGSAIMSCLTPLHIIRPMRTMHTRAGWGIITLRQVLTALGGTPPPLLTAGLQEARGRAPFS